MAAAVVVGDGVVDRSPARSQPETSPLVDPWEERPAPFDHCRQVQNRPLVPILAFVPVPS